MARLKKEQIIEIVKKALQSVGDVSGEIESYEFKHFQEQHKMIFLKSLKENLNQSPYYFRSGETSRDKYYDVPLSMGEFDQWSTVHDCIEYILNNHYSDDRLI